MSKLIPKHQKGKSVKYFGAYDPKQQAYVLPVYKKEGVVLPEITITPKNNTDLGGYMQNRDFGLGKEIISYTPAGDVMDAAQIYKDTKQGNYRQAALGVGLFFLPDVLAKPIKRGLKKLNITKSKNIDQVSQLDWSPQSWFGDAGKRTKWTKEDEKILQSHVPEYLNIERESKENGTWLKMQNGDIWEGDPREWVMRKSRNAEPWETNEIWYTGVPNDITFNEQYIGDTWATNNKSVAKGYANRLNKPLISYKFLEPVIIRYGKDIINNIYQKFLGKGNIYTLGYPKNLNQADIDVEYNNWLNIPSSYSRKLIPQNWEMPPVPKATDLDWHFYDWKNHEYNISTDELLRRSRLVNNNITKIRNVEDLANKSKIKYNDDLIIHEGTPRISFLGNNGDLTGKSIYR